MFDDEFVKEFVESQKAVEDIIKEIDKERSRMLPNDVEKIDKLAVMLFAYMITEEKDTIDIPTHIIFESAIELARTRFDLHQAKEMLREAHEQLHGDCEEEFSEFNCCGKCGEYSWCLKMSQL